MQKERLGGGSARQAVQVLNVSASAERGEDQSLRFATGEKSRAVHTRHNARFTGHFAKVAGGPTVGSLAAFQNVVAIDIFLNGFEGHAHVVLVVVVAEAFLASCPSFILDSANRYFAFLFRVGENRFLDTVTRNFPADVEHGIGSDDEFELFLFLSA